MSALGRPPMGRNRLLHFLPFVKHTNAWLVSQLDAGWWNTLNSREMKAMFAWADMLTRYAGGETAIGRALEVPAFLRAKETALLAKEDARIPLTAEEETELEVCNGLRTIVREAQQQATRCASWKDDSFGARVPPDRAQGGATIRLVAAGVGG
ncbi:hypothetical protein Rt10032_c06g2937 [Rhodotorula toruloides]|uniref:Uncharacterized protein n=1 Tax=Rhodotorula toruloides TaxID=5286 RepID=A0A511KEX2_RHOTO|nr:hypothetical protein Rt10032_c06g2937 [Rhodotorula toruloides]